MDPVRRAFFLLFFASVLLAEPGQARALIAVERAEIPAANPTARWIEELAVTLRQSIRPAAAISLPAWHAFRPDALVPLPLADQVAAAHPTFVAHAFRLPPPVA